MREEIENTIQEKLEEINPNLKEIYSDESKTINDMVNQQNENVNIEKKRQLILSILKEAKESGIDIDYNEEMSLEELETLAKNIEV